MKLIRSAAVTLLAYSTSHIPSCDGFSYSKRKQQLLSGAGSYSSTSLQYTNNADNDNNLRSGTASQKQQPKWVPMEIVELAAEDLQIPPSEFVRTYSDIEAYTSCDDEDGDTLHECDHFGQYLTPTKWLHLTPLAYENAVNELHFQIWKDVWENPHGSVEVADAVSKEALRYYNEFMLEEPRPSFSSTECHIRRPLVRIKVVPASFGLEGFEDAIWEATEDLLTQTSSDSDAKCRAVTFIVAAPDLSDPILMEKGKESPQVEFEPDRFRSFALTLRDKLRVFSEIEGAPSLMDEIELMSYHPLWKKDNSKSSISTAIVKIDGSSSHGCKYFPYPSVSVSMDVPV